MKKAKQISTRERKRQKVVKVAEAKTASARRDAGVVDVSETLECIDWRRYTIGLRVAVKFLYCEEERWYVGRVRDTKKVKLGSHKEVNAEGKLERVEDFQRFVRVHFDGRFEDMQGEWIGLFVEKEYEDEKKLVFDNDVRIYKSKR